MSAITCGNPYGVFIPVTNTHFSGSGTETIPSGASTVQIEVWGAGGHGVSFGGGGGGAYVLKTFTGIGSQANKTFSYSVPPAATVDGTAGTVTNGTFPTSTNLSAGGGTHGTSPSGGAGGSASGGDTNTAGNNGTFSGGGAAIVGSVSGDSAGKGGFDGDNGGAGLVVFTYT